MNYDHKAIEEKWQKYWEEKGVNDSDLKNAKRPFYNLMMFPYPSAEGLHVGNMYAFTGADVHGRFQKMRGFDVFEPMGLDGFGIHSENYAIKVNKHPMEQAKISEKRFYVQLRRIGNIIDWKHTVETYNPNYYKWTQWIFVTLFKAGLVERKKAPVNFCPSCKTVLADEQVIDGKCERCSTVVEKKNLEQWFFKITKYAEKLLKNLETIDWSEKVKTAQKLWIGKKTGINITYKIDQTDLSLTCFTTRPDTNYGATFLVVSPEHPILKELEYFDEAKKKSVFEYIEKAKSTSDEERVSQGRKKTGVFTGFYAVNQLNEYKMPIYVSDFVLMEFGTGVVVGVPGSDVRDFEFAKEFNLPIVRVVVGKDSDESDITDLGQVTEEGTMVNSAFLDGLERHAAGEKMMDFMEEKGWGKRVTTFHLRDWLVSRQRYWGAPIPMVNCPKCGWVPVPENELPVLLPNVENWRPKGTGRGPLAGIPEFVHTKCPKCGGEADRETDVCDTFLDSSWYFLRYPSTDFNEVPFDKETTKKWLPVNIYIGGSEHSVLHLMYSRFVTMALHDLGYLDFEEPFTKFYAHGLIIKDGVKMSKSKGNIVNPDEYIERFGADTLRTYLMFLGPFSEGGDFRNFGVAGVYRFLNRVWGWSNKQISKFQINKSISNNQISNFKLQKLIKDVTEDLEKLRYNTAIAKLMEFLNYAVKNECDAETVKTYLRLLAPFAPHMTDELHSMFDPSKSIHQEMWPSFDEKAIVEEEVTVVVQVNGKLRAKCIMNNVQCTIKDEVEKLAREDEGVKKYLEGGVKKAIFVPGKLINFVVDKES